MNYIQRAQMAQKILTAAGTPDVTAVTLYGYRDSVNIHTHGPLPGFEYAPTREGGRPRCEFVQDGVLVELVYTDGVAA